MEATLQSPFGQTVLEPGVVTIGSTPDSRLVLHDARVSPHHAVLRSKEQGYTITDWGSTDGTFVNDQRLEPFVPRLLRAGDRLRIGETVFTYEVHEGPALVAGQRSRPESESAALAAPTEHTAYGAPLSSVSPDQTQYGSAPQQEYAPAPPQQSYTPIPPSYQPYTPSAPSQPYIPPAAPSAIPAYGVPPPQPPYTPPSPQKRPGSWLKIALIAVAVLFVLAGVGVGAFLLLRPQPVISVTSDYKVGSTPAGATGTVFHVSGKQFSNNSTITFLLDGKPVSAERLVQSDANGNVKTDLTVTSDWAVGHHILTARDAENYITKAGVAIVIVPQGQALTPGPNGAPPDDMSFTIGITLQRTDSVTGAQLNPWNETLIITGSPEGGTVRQSDDDGQPHTFSTNPSMYTDTYVAKSSGTYKGGELSYTETYISQRWSFSSGLTCESQTPSEAEYLVGTFSDQHTISGTVNNAANSILCSDGSTTLSKNAATGTWTGTLGQGGTTSLITSPVQAGLEAIWTKPFDWA